MRQRVSLSLTKKLAESIDAHVGVLGASRSAVIERMLQNFLDTERTCVILAIYGGVKYDNNTSAVAELEGNKIINYWDTPKTEKTRLVSTMIGFSEPDIFKLIPPCPSSLHMDIFPPLAKKRVLGGVIVSGNFVNVHGREDANTAKKISKTGWQPR